MLVRVEGLGPRWDGDYPLDWDALTNRELRTIKRMSNVRAGELSEALLAGDNDVLLALAAIALERAGKPVSEDQLLDSEVGHISFVDDEAEDGGAVPPQGEPALPSVGDENTPRSGLSSVTSSGQSQSLPDGTGSRGSDISSQESLQGTA